MSSFSPSIATQYEIRNRANKSDPQAKDELVVACKFTFDLTRHCTSDIAHKVRLSTHSTRISWVGQASPSELLDVLVGQEGGMRGRIVEVEEATPLNCSPGSSVLVCYVKLSKHLSKLPLVDRLGMPHSHSLAASFESGSYKYIQDSSIVMTLAKTRLLAACNLDQKLVIVKRRCF